MKNILPILTIGLFSLPIKAQEQEPEIKTSTEHLNVLNNTRKAEIFKEKKIPINEFKKNTEILKKQLSVAIESNPLVYSYAQRYISYNWLPKVIGISKYYFSLFEIKAKKYQVPDELKYLAVVESALNPTAVSPAGAKGLWQFMPGTGDNFGLKENEYVDIFLDPVANTDCAMNYLKQLNSRYNNWLLAISAYNCGAGNVDKAIQKANSSDYWVVRRFLPLETQAYIPSFLALCYVFNFYQEHGIEIPNFKYSFMKDFKPIVISEDTNINEISQKYNTPLNILLFANPQLLSNFIPKGSIVYTLKTTYH